MLEVTVVELTCAMLETWCEWHAQIMINVEGVHLLMNQRGTNNKETVMLMQMRINPLVSHCHNR